MNILLEIVFKPAKTLEYENISRTTTWPVALSLYATFLFADIFLVYHIGGSVPGGNPMLWATDGVWYEFNFVRELFGTNESPFWNSRLFWAAIAYKSIADAVLIITPALNAKFLFSSDMSRFQVWARGYLYTLAACDMFLIIAMLPWFAYEFGWVHISAQHAAVSMHLLEIWVAGLNLVLFGYWYSKAFMLSFQQAYLGWFGLTIIPFVIFISILLIIAP